jgi:hypothetical protein
MWVVVAMACGSCNTQAVSLHAERPTQADIDAAKAKAGGGCCVAAFVSQAEPGKGPADLGDQVEGEWPASPAGGGGPCGSTGG